MPNSQKAFLALIVATAITAVVVPIFNPKLFTDTGWVTYAAAAITLLGWLTREYFAIRALRKQHTVGILLQSRMSTAFNDRYKTMLKVFPVTPAIVEVKAGDWNDAEKIEAIEALKYFLNFYEFIAIGVRTGDLDEEYLYMSLGGIVPNLCKLGSAYIDFCRNASEAGHQDVFVNLLWLRDRWVARTATRTPRVKP